MSLHAKASLHATAVAPVPEQTARVAHAAFPKGNPYRGSCSFPGKLYVKPPSGVPPPALYRWDCRLIGLSREY